MKKIGQDFVDAVRSMTAKEIIMHMVESLRNPVTEIKMSTYGQTDGIKCFGCAATNFIAHKLNYSKEDLMDMGSILITFHTFSNRLIGGNIEMWRICQSV